MLNSLRTALAAGWSTLTHHRGARRETWETFPDTRPVMRWR